MLVSTFWGTSPKTKSLSCKSLYSKTDTLIGRLPNLLHYYLFLANSKKCLTDMVAMATPTGLAIPMGLVSVVGFIRCGIVVGPLVATAWVEASVDTHIILEVAWHKAMQWCPHSLLMVA